MASTPMTSLAEIRERAQALGPKRVCVVKAEDEIAIGAAGDAMRLGIAMPTLVGNYEKIVEMARALDYRDLVDNTEIIDSAEPAVTSAKLAADGHVDILLKGHLRTDQIFKAVLDKSYGLRTGRLLSDVLFYEDTLSERQRLVGITDGGLNVAPTLEQKKDIIKNAIEMLDCIGIKQPKIAVMSASEAVSEGVPSTVDAELLTRMGEEGEFGDAVVFGPLALDNALLMSAAKAKGISHPVAGQADCLIVPSVEAGNFLGKSVKYFGGKACAHVVVGAKIPVLIPSRVESAEDKLNAIALGVLYASR
ncbi:phosphate acyltransferase [uncultured Cohaesibacter sp.]|uniref:phosphate acyltransferase n=1 Tax=uncultured Cohaesibacter sp. TaxID=1002546 RepID=UPI0029308EB4|nr:phosphate acyltransferase [uncultured Cohaesibacter sp.]